MPPKLAALMRGLGLLSFAFCALTLRLSAQQPTAATAPPQDEDVLRVSAELVQTDVAVLDKQGRFVDGLPREQFELLVDGRPQPISFFERVTAGSSREATLLAARRGDGRTTPGNAPNASASTTGGRTTFFFVDDLHLAPDSMKRTRDLLLRFVDGVMAQNDRAVIATASGQLGFLQQVTDNKRVLRAAVERLTYRPAIAADIGTPPMSEYQAIAIERNDRDALSYFVDDMCGEFKRLDRGSCHGDTGMTNNAVFDDTVVRARPGSNTTTGGSGTDPATGASTGRTAARVSTLSVRAEAERIVRQRARAVARQSAQTTLNTLASLESLVRTAAPLPERKLVVVISDGFFLDFINSTNAYDVRRIADAALRAGVVIYTLDARGLVTGQPDARTKGGFDQQGRINRLSVAEARAAQDPLDALAADTGGRAWRNSNDLAPGLAQALQETAAYYLLAWRPEPGQGKDRFRRIEVRVKERPDLTVRVRGGFFEDANGAAGNDVAAAGSNQPKTVEDELLAVIRASYPRRGLPTALSAGHMYVPGHGTALAASALVQASGADVDLMGVLVNEKGDVVSSLRQQLPAATAGRGGRMIYTMQFPGLAPGLYQVRVAARDSKSARTGSATQWIEVPDAAKGDFALSSIFLSEVPAGANAGEAQKATVSPDHLFARTSRLRFQAQVYNAPRPTAAAPDLTLELQLTTGGQVLIATPPSPVSTQGVTDLAHIPLTGEFPLGAFPVGRYTLTITITDRASQRSIKQQSDFTIE
jgi:VWFA-related protein